MDTVNYFGLHAGDKLYDIRLSHKSILSFIFLCHYMFPTDILPRNELRNAVLDTECIPFAAS